MRLVRVPGGFRNQVEGVRQKLRSIYVRTQGVQVLHSLAKGLPATRALCRLQWISRCPSQWNCAATRETRSDSKPTPTDTTAYNRVYNTTGSTSGPTVWGCAVFRYKRPWVVGGATRGPGASPRLPSGTARGRLRYARLSLSPNQSWWSRAVLAGEPRPQSRAGTSTDTTRKRCVLGACSWARLIPWRLRA